MPLPGIIINKQAGGLGRPLAGEDHITGLLFYNDTLPTGFSASDRIKAFFSLAEAEAAGIVEGDADHGVEWYHISEFFRLAPKGVLYVGYYALTAQAYDFAEIPLIQQFAEGKIRQFGIYAAGIAGVATAKADELQTQMAALYAAHTPAVAILATDISGVSDLSTLADLRSGTSAYYVSVLIGQDGGAAGKALYDGGSVSISALGAFLGTLSSAQVHENVGWAKKFKPSAGELDVAAFGNGDLVKDTALSLQDTLNDRGYIFLRKIQGLAGSFWNDAHCVVALTSDFAYIPASRTIDKAIRLCRAALLPEVNGPVTVDADTGQLSNEFVEYLKALSDGAINQMAQDGELSGYQTLINPEQNVLSTSNIDVTLELVPKGTARKITVNVGFKTQLSQ